MFKHLSILLCVFIFACNRMPDVEIVAHRGASYDAPENTIAAFKLAWQRGADCIEGDFFLTGDNQIVCIHDATTERTAGIELVVAESRVADLKALDVGSWKGPQWAGEKIPTIQEVFDTIPQGKKIFIEIKCGPEIVPFLKDAVKQSGLKNEQMIVISFKETVIAEVNKQIPELQVFWLTSYKQNNETGIWHPSPDDIMVTLKRINADGLDSNAHDIIDVDFVQALTDAGMEQSLIQEGA